MSIETQTEREAYHAMGERQIDRLFDTIALHAKMTNTWYADPELIVEVTDVISTGIDDREWRGTVSRWDEDSNSWKFYDDFIVTFTEIGHAISNVTYKITTPF